MSDTDINVIGLANNKPKSKISWKVVGAIIGVVVLAIGVYAGILLVKQQQNISEKASELMCTDPQAEQCPGTDGVLRNCHPPEAGGGPTESVCNLAGRAEFCGTRCFVCPSAGGIWTPTDMSKCQTAPTATATATASTQCSKMYFIKITGNSRSCVETTSTYNSSRIDCDGNTNQTCEQNLAQFNAGITTGVCYTTNALCLSALATPSPTSTSTATSTATPTSTATATATSIATKTPTATPTSAVSPTKTPTSTPKATSTAVAQVTNSPAPIPETGASSTTIIASGFGLLMILVSIALAL